MPIFQSQYATGRLQVPNSDSADVVAIRADFLVSNAMVDTTGVVRANLAVNDVIEMFDLPPDHVIDDLVFVADDIDASATPTVSIATGVINATSNGLDTSAANGGAAMIAASTIGQTGGTVRPSTTATWRLVPTASAARRRVGFHVVAAPATVQAGTLSLVARLRPAHGAA